MPLLDLSIMGSPVCVCVSRPEQRGRGAGNSSEECNEQHSLQQVSEQEQQIHAVQSESHPPIPSLLSLNYVGGGGGGGM